MNQPRLNPSNKFSVCITNMEISKKREKDSYSWQQILQSKNMSLIEMISKDAHVITNGSTLHVDGSNSYIDKKLDCQS